MSKGIFRILAGIILFPALSIFSVLELFVVILIYGFSALFEDIYVEKYDFISIFKLPITPIVLGIDNIMDDLIRRRGNVCLEKIINLINY